jgi:hypothetical protein
MAAYWELLFYHGLKALGFEVSCHPEVAGTTKRPRLPREGYEANSMWKQRFSVRTSPIAVEIKTRRH